MERNSLTPATGPAVAVVEIEKVFERRFAPVRALRGIRFEVPRAQFLCVMGPSGSGKSTLLHILSGLRTPTAGRVRIGETEIQSLSQDEAAVFRRRNIGLVFQFFNLISMLSVEENIALPLLLEGWNLSQLHARIEPLMETLGISERRHHSTDELSGGEMQRVAIARALIVEPQLVLADEPTGNLDSKNGAEILALLRRLCDEQGVTIILMTHNLGAVSYADRVIVLRDGRISEDLPSHQVGQVM